MRGIERQWVEGLRVVADRVVPGDVAPIVPGNVGAQAAQHEYPLDGRRQLTGAIGDRLHVHLLAGAGKAVGGDQHASVGIAQAGGDRLRAKPREDRHRDRPELRAGVVGRHRLGRHRHEQPDRVAVGDPGVGERPGDPVGEPPQLGPAELAAFAALSSPR